MSEALATYPKENEDEDEDFNSSLGLIFLARNKNFIIITLY